MQYRDAGRILGLTCEANRAEVKEAYRLAAKAVHPDVGGSNEAMTKVNEAYHLLEDGYNPGRLGQGVSFLEDIADFTQAIHTSQARRGVLSETAWQRLFIPVLESVGCLVLNNHATQYQKSGWPDLFIASPHWTGWAELKVDQRGFEPNQQEVIAQLKRRGTNAVVLRYSNRIKAVRVEDENGQIGALLKDWRNGQDVLGLLQSSVEV